MSQNLPSGGDNNTLPQSLSSLVKENTGIEHVLVFTYDGLLYAFSETFPFSKAERLAAIANQMRQLGSGFGRLTNKGEAENLLVRFCEDRQPTDQLLITHLTSYSGLAVVANSEGSIAQLGYTVGKAIDSLTNYLPEEVPSRVGAPLILARTNP